jgi:hypothetical protein
LSYLNSLQRRKNCSSFFIVVDQDFAKEGLSEVETDEDNEETSLESETEDDNNTGNEGEYMSGSEGRSTESEEDDHPTSASEDALAAAETIKAFIAGVLNCCMIWSGK